MLIVSLLPVVGRVSWVWSWYNLQVWHGSGSRSVMSEDCLAGELSPAMRVFHVLLFTRAVLPPTKHH
jgi:hypothetical protein